MGYSGSVRIGSFSQCGACILGGLDKSGGPGVQGTRFGTTGLRTSGVYTTIDRGQLTGGAPDDECDASM